MQEKEEKKEKKKKEEEEWNDATEIWSDEL